VKAHLARGYSLAEVVVVIVIAGILAAILIPQFSQPAIDAAWYHEQVRSAVRHAQRTAVAQRRPVFIVVEAGPKLSLCYASACGAGTRLTQPGSTNTFELPAPSGVALGISASPLSFNGLGQPSSGATVTVGGRTITIQAETGYVQ
jgi:MSHA pilin protein MshC